RGTLMSSQHKSFRRGQRVRVERRESPRQRVDEVVELAVGNRTIDPPVALRGGRVVVVAGRDDLQRAGGANQIRETLDPTARRHDADADLGLSEQCVLEAREPKVARKRELAAATAGAT